MQVLLYIVVVSLMLLSIAAEREIHDPLNIFCGTLNCYDIIGIPRTSTAEQIRKAYRKLSISAHPDKNPEADATVKFQRIGKAYEVLKGNESRPLFDYYLDHPWDYYKVSGQYLMRNMPKSNVIVVLIVVLSLLSVLLYQVQMQNHNQVKDKLRRAVLEGLGPKNGGTEYTANLFEVCSERYYAKAESSGLAKSKNQAKMMADSMFEEVVKEVVSEIEIEGGNKKPTFHDILIVRVFMFPLTLIRSFTDKKSVSDDDKAVKKD